MSIDSLTKSSAPSESVYYHTWQVPPDITRTAAVATGDKAPVHEDDDYAERTVFRRRICQGVVVVDKVLGWCNLHRLYPAHFTLGFPNPIHPSDRVDFRFLSRPDPLILGKNNLAVQGWNRTTERANREENQRQKGDRVQNRTSEIVLRSEEVPVVENFLVAVADGPLHSLQTLAHGSRDEGAHRLLRTNGLKEGVYTLPPEEHALLNTLLPISELVPGCKVVSKTVVTEETLRAMRAILDSDLVPAGVLGPNCTTRILSLFGGEKGEEATMIFRSLEGLLTTGNELMRPGVALTTVVTVKENTVNRRHPETQQPLSRKLRCDYSVQDQWGRLISRGGAGLQALSYPQK